MVKPASGPTGGEVGRLAAQRAYILRVPQQVTGAAPQKVRQQPSLGAQEAAQQVQRHAAAREEEMRRIDYWLKNHRRLRLDVLGEPTKVPEEKRALVLEVLHRDEIKHSPDFWKAVDAMLAGDNQTLQQILATASPAVKDEIFSMFIVVDGCLWYVSRYGPGEIRHYAVTWGSVKPDSPEAAELETRKNPYAQPTTLTRLEDANHHLHWHADHPPELPQLDDRLERQLHTFEDAQKAADAAAQDAHVAEQRALDEAAQEKTRQRVEEQAREDWRRRYVVVSVDSPHVSEERPEDPDSRELIERVERRTDPHQPGR